MQLDEIPQLALTQLTVCLGGALPQTVSGVPAWSELAETMSAALHVDAPQKNDLAAVAQRSLRGESRWELIGHLKQMLNKAGHIPQRIHQLIASLPARAFITTTYDDLLRRAFEATDKPINYCLRGDQLRLRNMSLPDLFQIFGEPGHPNTLVITEDDYAQLWQNSDKQPLLDRIRLVFQDSLVLLIGYDLGDPAFGLIWREVLMKLGQPAGGFYALAPNLSETDCRMWQGRGLKVVDAEPIAAIETLLQRLNHPSVQQPIQPVFLFKDSAPPNELTKSKLLDAMKHGFSRGELAALCAEIEPELGQATPLTLELIGGEDLGETILRLIELMDRNNMRNVLEAAVRRTRPNLLDSQ